MPGPSLNARPNLITWKRWTPTQDADAGAIGNLAGYTETIASNVRCGAHLVSSEEHYDNQNRRSTLNTWKISTNADYGLRLNDLGQFTLDGVAHNVFVKGYVNRSGRSVAYETICTERL